MALRRRLPSRATPDTAPESAATPAFGKPTTEDRPNRRPLSETHAVPPPAEVTYDMPNAAAENAPAPVVANTEAFAAAATSAFGTLPTAAPARSLEDSFVKAPTEEPAPAPEAEFTAPAFSAPAFEAEIVTEAAPVIIAETVIVTTPAVPEFSAPAWNANPETATAPAFSAPALEATPAPIAEAKPEPTPEPAPILAAPMLPAAEPEAPAPAPEPEPAPAAPQSQPAAPAFQPSRPDNNQIKRRVREKRPRDFTAMGSPEGQKPERNTPNTSFAPTVPVHTQSLEKVDEDLIATGIMEGPAADSLTGSLPTGVAEMTFAPPVQPASAPAPKPEPQPEPKPEPVAPAPIVIPTPAPEPVIIAAPAPQPAPEPVIVPIPVPEPTPTPAPAAPTPAFLSNATPIKVSEPLPPPQSDLPWTQPQGAADWEIETPESDGWAPDTGHDTVAAGASHMPPPADLYKPMSTGPTAPQMPASGLPPRTGNNYTPELPGQRHKSGSSPWVFIALAVLVAAGAGAWFLRGKGSNQSQQQLANLTKPAEVTPQTDANGILLPPQTDNASFYTPPAVAADTSSSAVVAFADVPPEQANQPIVATGTEEIPANMNLMDKFKAEVEKARALKAGQAAAVPDATTPTPAPTATSAITPDKLQEELAAYRNALASSPNPSALTPSAFRKDPDGYMDGKPQQTTDGQLASNALLPPPTGGADGSMLPPPDLYTNNPKNLPVVAEPVAAAPQRVRTLSDFPDIEPYAPEREKVEIPRNMKPKMAATDFPALEVLSFVPGKGIVAFADGREGVLLIGESINGWELVNVTPDNAEFKTGQKSYQVTADN